ncbi:MAG: hypothetical protein ABH821_03100 [archaeon]
MKAIKRNKIMGCKLLFHSPKNLLKVFPEKFKETVTECMTAKGDRKQELVWSLVTQSMPLVKELVKSRFRKPEEYVVVNDLVSDSALALQKFLTNKISDFNINQGSFPSNFYSYFIVPQVRLTITDYFFEKKKNGLAGKVVDKSLSVKQQPVFFREIIGKRAVKALEKDIFDRITDSKTRKTLNLRLFEQKSFETIAKELNVSRQRTAVLFFDGLCKLGIVLPPQKNFLDSVGSRIIEKYNLMPKNNELKPANNQPTRQNFVFVLNSINNYLNNVPRAKRKGFNKKKVLAGFGLTVETFQRYLYQFNLKRPPGPSKNTELFLNLLSKDYTVTLGK